MNKDLVKYAVIALGAYLVYQYVESQGGIQALLGMTPAGAAPIPPGTPSVTTAAPAPATDAPPAAPTQPAAALDLTGLVVSRDVNNSLAGTVKINGHAQRLAILQTDGRIFNSSGQDVTSALASSGVNVDQLRTAFAQAGAGLAGFAPLQRNMTALWLM